MLFLACMLLLSASSPLEKITFSDLGWEEIVVPPLSKVESNCSWFTYDRIERVRLRITIYYSGSLQISLKINNATIVYTHDTVEAKVVLKHNNSIRISVVNTGYREGIIYGNSTIEIYREAGPATNGKLSAIRMAFILSMIVPLFVLYFVRRRSVVETEDVEPLVVVSSG